MDGTSSDRDPILDRPVTERVYRVAFAFCGIGGGALGFKWARATLTRLGLSARFEIVGGIECDESTARDFERLTGAPCLVAKVEELTPERLREFFGAEVDVWFFSPPCKAASPLLDPALAATPKYQEMGMLGAVFIDLMFLAWPRGPRLILMENVPRIRTKFPQMLAHIRRTCRKHRFHIHEAAHDLGELGGLAQHRDRLLFVGRRDDVPALLYQPVKRRVRSIGEVLSQLPLPGDPAAGRLHRLPAIDAITALRLALIPAGGDWHDLPEQVHLHPSFARLLKRCPAPSERTPSNDVWRVMRWDEAADVVTAGSTPSAGAMSIADPRVGRAGEGRSGDHGVIHWGDAAGTVTCGTRPSNGRFSAADPRPMKPCHPRTYGVIPWEGTAGTITGNTAPGGGPFAVANPRVTCKTFKNSGIYGVVPWAEPAYTITAHACHDNGRHSLADPRELAPRNPFPVIVALDGTIHRPMTPLERAILQDLPAMVDGFPLDLEGDKKAVGIKIGDLVPPGAAEAIAVQMLYTLLHADAGVFALSGGGAVWVDGPAREVGLQ